MPTVPRRERSSASWQLSRHQWPRTRQHRGPAGIAGGSWAGDRQSSPSLLVSASLHGPHIQPVFAHRFALRSTRLRGRTRRDSRRSKTGIHGEESAIEINIGFDTNVTASYAPVRSDDLSPQILTGEIHSRSTSIDVRRPSEDLDSAASYISVPMTVAHHAPCIQLGTRQQSSNSVRLDTAFEKLCRLATTTIMCVC